MFLSIIFAIASIFVFRMKMDFLSRRIILIYMILWSTDMIVMSYGLYDLPKTSVQANLFLFMGNISFVMGFLSIKIAAGRNLDMNTPKLTNQVRNLLRNKLFMIILIGITAYVLFLFSKFYAMILVYQSLGDLRSEFYDNNIYGSVYTILSPYVIEPLKVVTPFLVGYMLLNKKLIKGNLLAFVLMIIFLFFSSSLSGSRFSYVKIVLPIFFVLYLSVQRINLKKITFLGASIYIFFLFISFITSARSGEFSSNDKGVGLEAITSYTFAPIAAFDYSLKHDYVSKLGGHGYGSLTLSSVENLFYSVVSKLGVTYHRPIGYLAETTQSYISLSPSMNWNALYTWFLYFYLDFGVFGIFLFPFLIGRFYRMLIRIFYSYNRVEYAILASNFFMIIIFSVFMWNFGSIGLVLTYITLFIFAKKAIHFSK